MARNSINVLEKTWTRVLANKTNASILRPLNMGSYTYYCTTREPDDTAPSDASNTDPLELDSGLAYKIFEDKNIEQVISSSPLDIYLWAFNNDNDSSDTAKVNIEL